MPDVHQGKHLCSQLQHVASCCTIRTFVGINSAHPHTSQRSSVEMNPRIPNCTPHSQLINIIIIKCSFTSMALSQWHSQSSSFGFVTSKHPLHNCNCCSNFNRDCNFNYANQLFNSTTPAAISVPSSPSSCHMHMPSFSCSPIAIWPSQLSASTNQLGPY